MLGLSSDAEMSAIQSVGKRRLMAMRLEDDPDPKMVADIERALEALANPVTRFEEGLFALEMTDSEAEAFRADPVLSRLGANPDQDGVAAYGRICEADNPTTLAHNRGSLRFMQAVAATREAQEGTPDDISDDLACVELWKDAYKSLRLAFESDKFWLRQKLRAKSYEDKRLSPERVEEIRAGIYRRVIEPVGHVVTQALLSRHGKVAKAYVDLLKGSGFDETFVEGVLSTVYKPLADRVEKAVEALQESLSNAGDSEARYKALLREFKQKVELDLKVMLEVGDLPGYAEEHARDTAAGFLRSLSIQAFNSSEAVDVAKSAIRLAEKYVDSSSDRAKYKKDLAAILEQEKQQKKFAKHKAEFEKLKSAMDMGDLSSALQSIDRLIAAGADEDGSLQQLRKNLSTALATELFNDGMRAMNAGGEALQMRLGAASLQVARSSLDTAIKKFEEALRWETVPSEIEIIRKALAQARSIKGMLDSHSGRPAASQSTGCLVALLQLFAGFVLMGLLGGVLHACTR